MIEHEPLRKTLGAYERVHEHALWDKAVQNLNKPSELPGLIGLELESKDEYEEDEEDEEDLQSEEEKYEESEAQKERRRHESQLSQTVTHLEPSRNSRTMSTRLSEN